MPSLHLLAVLLVTVCVSTGCRRAGDGAPKGASGTMLDRPHSEVLPGLYPPADYGHSCWASLDARVRRNLSSQLVDLARIETARGNAALALSAATEAVDLQLRYPVPADQTLISLPTFDRSHRSSRPVTVRLGSALTSGWFGASALTLGVLDPQAAPQGWPSTRQAGHQDALRLVLEVRRLRAVGEVERARAVAADADRFIRLERDALLRSLQANADDYRTTEGWEYLVGDPMHLDSPWGWIPPDFVLDRLSGYLAEVGQPGLVAAQGSTPGLEPRKVNPRNLARVPT